MGLISRVSSRTYRSIEIEWQESMFRTNFLLQKKTPDETSPKKAIEKIKTMYKGENKGLKTGEITTKTSTDGGPPKVVETPTKITAKEALKDYQPGEGIAKKAKDTSSVFRALNFEMYAKPNLKVA